MTQRVAKAKDQLVKQQKKNRRIEMENLMYQCQAGEKGLQDMSIKDSSDLMWFIDDRLKAVGPQDGVLPSSGTPTRRCCCSSCSSRGPKDTSRGGSWVTWESNANGCSSQASGQSGHCGVPRGQDTMHPGPYDHYENPSFWGHPFFTWGFGSLRPKFFLSRRRPHMN